MRKKRETEKHSNFDSILSRQKRTKEKNSTVNQFNFDRFLNIISFNWTCIVEFIRFIYIYIYIIFCSHMNFHCSTLSFNELAYDFISNWRIIYNKFCGQDCRCNNALFDACQLFNYYSKLTLEYFSFIFLKCSEKCTL